MKEKIVPCPNCGHSHPIKNEGYQFLEIWDKALADFAYKWCGISGVEMWSNGKIVEIGCYPYRGHRELDPVPTPIKEWIALNPRPKLTRDQFLHQLGLQFAQKGGQL